MLTNAPSKEERRFAFDIGWVFFGSVITSAIGLPLGIILARWLGPTNLGLYSLSLTIYGLATILALFGIPAAVIKYAAEYKEDRDRLSQIISSGLFISIIFGLVIAILLYALSGLLAGIFDKPDVAGLLKILAFAFPFGTVFSLYLGLFNGLRKMKLYTSLVIIKSCLTASFIIAFVLLGFGLKWVIGGVVLSEIASCLLGLLLVRPFLHLNLRDFFKNCRKLLSFGGQIMAAGAVNTITVHTDTIMIGYFLVAAQLGYYSRAIVLSQFFWLIPQAIQRITYPATSEYWAKKDRSALDKMVNKSIKSTACILLPIGLIVGFFANGIITTLYGREYIPAALPLLILLIGTVIRGVAQPIGGTLAAIGRPDLALKITALTAAMNVGLNIVLIPKFGISGAAIATTVSLATGAFIILGLNIKMLSIRIDTNWFLRMAGITLLAVALFLLGKQLLNLYLVGGVVLFIYLILVLKFFLTGEDRGLVKSLAYSLMPRRWSHE